MKKKNYLAIAFMFLCPLTASATPIVSGVMNVLGSGPNAGGYAADYDITSVDRNVTKKIDFASTEVFCVEGDQLIPSTVYDFYSSDGGTAQDLLTTWADNYKQVTWIASYTTQDWGTTFNNEKKKAIGQVAIWKLLDITPASTKGWGKYDTAANTLISTTFTDAYANDWLLAESYSSGGVTDGQNYLVKAAPVPEPATMLLFGTGLIGLAGAARRRKNS